MSDSTLVQALRRQRDELATRWLRQFATNRAVAGRTSVAVEATLAAGLLDEVAVLLATSQQERIPRRHNARTFASLAVFPECVALCIDLYQAGAQVIGAFIVENAGPYAAWNTTARNAYLAELDAVFHILVHREIEALCELRPVRALDSEGDPESVTPPAPPSSGDVPRGTFLRN
jgi:hypothetical protein